MPKQPVKQQPETQTSPQGSDPVKIAVDFIIKNEGFKNKAYWDKTGKVWTIGNGLTTYSDGTPVKQGDTITAERNQQELYHHIQADHEFLKSRPAYVAMNPNQIASALDLTFNIGHNWTKSKNASLLEATSSPEKLASFPDAMRKYNKSGGKFMQGLANRRERAVELFNSPVDEQEQKPLSINDKPITDLLTRGNDGLPTLDTKPSDA